MYLKLVYIIFYNYLKLYFIEVKLVPTKICINFALVRNIISVDVHYIQSELILMNTMLLFNMFGKLSHSNAVLIRANSTGTFQYAICEMLFTIWVTS